MAHYFIGDIQGCHDAFKSLLEKVDFSPSRDTLFLLGDLVNRGPDSASVLRQCMRWGTSVQAVLGNHDLHLMAQVHGIRKPSRRDTLDNVINAPDATELMAWLITQPLARVWSDKFGQKVLMIHAGIHPSWTCEKTLQLASEVQQHLQSKNLKSFLSNMYGNTPQQWNDGLQGADRLRFIVNALTRMRFCSADGQMDFQSSEAAEYAPPGLMPWFMCPNRATQNTIVAFGHWSTLGLHNEPKIMALDTGCVWGGELTAIRIENDANCRELFQVKCSAALNPLD